MTPALPSLEEAKQMARTLRRRQADGGTNLSHAQALEQVSRGLGYRDWNSLRAAIERRAAPAWRVGQRVRGAYLGQPFEGAITAAQSLEPGWFRLSLEFDEPVDVVRFARFSNLRKRLQCVVGPKGESRERTSDGEPHMKLEF